MNRQYQIQDSAGEGELEKLKQLLEPTHTQLELDMALENAIAYSRIEVGEYLINLGADLSNNDFEGVYYAVHNNELDGLKFSVAQGVDVNIRDGLLLNTSIETAINTGDCSILEWLLENGANPKFITKHSKQLAKRFGTVRLQELLK